MNKILLVVEGARKEVKFFEAYFRALSHDSDVHFFVFGTDHNQLYRMLKSYDKGGSFGVENVDLIDVLKEQEKKNHHLPDPLLDQPFTDIFLIFDFDYHITCSLNQQTVFTYFSEHFQESTNGGLFLTNFPMMESYHHQAIIGEPSFLFRTIQVGQSHDYKKLSRVQGNTIPLNSYTLDNFLAISGQNAAKTNFLLYGNSSLPSYEEFLAFKQADLISEIFADFIPRQLIPVLNTSAFIPLLYYGQTLYQQLP